MVTAVIKTDGGRLRHRGSHSWGESRHAARQLLKVQNRRLSHRAGEKLRFRGSGYSDWVKAASKAIWEAVRSVRRTKASASGAPCSRSMPLSSHSIDSGPW